MVNTVTAGIRGAEVSPVCAVMGGIVGQELLKAISRKDEPIQNFFFFQGNKLDMHMHQSLTSYHA